TTAHAAAELNNDDKGTRKCILMESDDKIPAKHLAKKMGFSMISEITKKRLQLIKEEYPNFRFKVIENKSDVKELSAICE
ncbi:site-specific DNA-methyltransferase, partial [Vibrio parahaemolyticus]|nr:site-specific DNA-methyltransferase [Vibrio parahaemolyticus]